jgi:hypothetical protein
VEATGIEEEEDIVAINESAIGTQTNTGCSFRVRNILY